ncbi:hypothetical protein CHU32_21085 [Superficieibacter electus]|uniref:Bbp19-like phage domain-containing protein n=1 Tax=Superficieibacter electus TaxID=2022662 RepID=A0A2P5GJW9_9ENTR|nr:hypothetical protein [Superficieibacter electus]POP42145.1 hypothetical protein CHU33_20200 [Superficieibacter electus]POP44453.1 hypothetical protein CHU32_21085 [Superficieibacter electus]
MTDIWEEEKLTAQQERAIQEREERDAEDIRYVMATERGRRVVWNLLEQGKVFASTFAVEPHVTSFNEGQRNVSLALFSRVMAVCPELYLKMAEEQRQQNKEVSGD